MLDVAFGTFKEKFDEYEKDEYKKSKDKTVSMRADAKSTLLNWSLDFVAYLALGLACMAAWIYWPNFGSLSSADALPPALIAGFGPVIIAFVFDFMTGEDYMGSGSGILKDGPLAAVTQIGIGTLFCSVPISIAVYLAGMPPPSA
jgi:hypothetical protein